MGLVEDRNVPLLVEILKGIEDGDAVRLGVVGGLLREVDGGDDEVLLLPDVLVGMGLPVCTDRLTVVDDEVAVELFAHLLLPLDGQRRRRNDEYPVGAVAGDELLDDDPGFDGLPEADLVADEVAVVVGVENLVGGLDLIGFDLDAVAGQREESVVLVGEIESDRPLPKIVMERGVGLAGCEPVDKRIEFLDVREAAGEFAELALRGVDMEEVPAVGPFLDFSDFSTPAGEFDVVADFVITHRLLSGAFHHFDFLLFKLV